MAWKLSMVLLRKKIKYLFNVDYNKSAKLCNHCIKYLKELTSSHKLKSTQRF